jgi:hypothetical protein
VAARLRRSTVARKEGVGTAAREEARRETVSKARARRKGGSGLKKKTAEETRSERTVKRGGRSAFNAMTGHAGRLNGRSGAASGQSPVSS